MEKCCCPPQGYYKSLETAAIFHCRILCNRKPDVLDVYQQIVAKKIQNRRPMFMVQWQGYYLPPELIEAFENPAPDPVRVEEARQRIGLVFERGMNVLLQHEESIKIRHDVVHFLFPNFPVHMQLTLTEVSDRELEYAGLAPYVEQTISANGNRCPIVQLTFRLLLSKSPSFYRDGKKVSCRVECLCVVFRKKYLLGNL